MPAGEGRESNNGEFRKDHVATDGSDAAIDAARRSMDLLRPHAQVMLVMVIPEYEDPMDDAGGIEGPGVSPKQADKDWKRSTATGQSALDRTAAVLGPDVEVRLVPDDEATGAAICPSCPRDECRRACDRFLRQELVEATFRRLRQRLRGASCAMSSHADPPRPLSTGPPTDRLRTTRPIDDPHLFAEAWNRISGVTSPG